MKEQLGLQLDPAPVAHRTAALFAFVPRLESAAEALAGEARTAAQDALVLRAFKPGERMTPSDVELYLVDHFPPPTPLLTSIRRSLTNLTRRGLLVHHKADRRPGPRGARESVWSLA